MFWFETKWREKLLVAGGSGKGHQGRDSRGGVQGQEGACEVLLA